MKLGDILSTHELWGPQHTSWEIIGSAEGDLRGYCIVLGITGSAAAYKSIDLARTLMRMGAIVRVVMTKEAQKLVSPALFEWATGLPVVSEVTGKTEHVSLAKYCDAMVVAPATLDTISEIIGRRASTPVSLTAQELRGRGKRVLLVPSMHGGMWERLTPILSEAESQGFIVMEPVITEGRAKYPDIDHLAWWVESIVTRGLDLKGYRILVTAGATWEYIDPVRIITNPSTGLMGVSIALEALWRGARVILLKAHTHVQLPSTRRLEVHSADTTEDLVKLVETRIEDNIDAAFYAAAVADYRPAATESTKIPTETGGIEIKLEPTPKVVSTALEKMHSALHVGFAAETASSDRELLEKAIIKLKKYKLDLVAANNVLEEGAGFATDTNRLLVVSWRGRIWVIPRMHKRRVARRLLDIAERMLKYGESRYQST